jgi:hypothetical protein
MRYGKLNDGRVTDAIECGQEDMASGIFGAGWVALPDHAGVGSVWDNGDFVQPGYIEPDRATYKRMRALAVATIVVTTSSGRAFNGDEASQSRLSRAIAYLQEAGLDQTDWVLADNSKAAVHLSELKEALMLAFKRQSEEWT